MRPLYFILLISVGSIYAQNGAYKVLSEKEDRLPIQNAYTNAFKIDLYSSLLNGDIPFIYERLLYKRWTGEVGLGYNYGKHFIDYAQGSDFNMFEDLSYVNYTGNPKPSLSYRLGLRYYFHTKHKAFESSYIGINYLNRRTERDYYEQTYKIYPTNYPEYNYFKSNQVFNLIWGAQTEEKNLLMDIYFGAGFSITKENKYIFNDSNYPYIQTSFQSFNIVSLFFTAGLRFGLVY